MRKSPFKAQVSDFYEFFGKSGGRFSADFGGAQPRRKAVFWHHGYHGRGRISKPGRLERITQRPGIVCQAERGNDIYNCFEFQIVIIPNDLAVPKRQVSSLARTFA